MVVLECHSDELMCPTTGRCVLHSDVCNYANDCGDNWDEQNCSEFRFFIKPFCITWKEKKNWYIRTCIWRRVNGIVLKRAHWVTYSAPVVVVFRTNGSVTACMTASWLMTKLTVVRRCDVFYSFYILYSFYSARVYLFGSPSFCSVTELYCW